MTASPTQTTELIERKIADLPKEPGVYLMKNAAGKIIYVGKAKVLRNRVRSYFRGTHTHPKLQKLVARIEDFEILLTTSETEALLLERHLIKKHQPKYNVLLRDDKSFPLVRIDKQSKWPRISKVRRTAKDGAKYIGPFVNESQLYRLLNAAFKIFPLVRCSEHEFRNAKRPCNYYHMKMCMGPCALPVKREDYLKVVEDAEDFLLGRNRELANNLKTKMLGASENEQYEKAGMYRDQLKALEKMLGGQAVIVKGLEEADVFGFAMREGHVAVHVNHVRSENLSSYDQFVFECFDEPGDAFYLDFLLHYYDSHPLPQRIALQYIRNEDLFGERFFEIIDTDRKEKKADSKTQTKLLFPKKAQKKEMVEIAVKNAEHALKRKLESMDKAQTALAVLRERLKLTRYPERIECIDVSHLQGDQTVASCVCMLGGKPYPEGYRKYNVKSLEPGKVDDYQSMREVIGRRIRRGIEEDTLPDLLVIDGGKGQLGAALDALEEFPGIPTEVVGLAKARNLETMSPTRGGSMLTSEERIFKPGCDRPIPLKTGSPSYRILVKLRDEAHRFAITFHRQKKAKAALDSPLESIPGVGPKTRQKLVTAFDGWKNLEKATLSQIQGVDGVSSKQALAVFTFFNQG